MKTVAIIQARLGSNRLPGKVLADIAGATMLARVIDRARACQAIDEVVVATTTSPTDDAVVDEARRCDAIVARGSETDVLDRYVRAARQVGADAVVRITSDCPLLDPEVVGWVVGALIPQIDYASNTHRRTFPRGLDCEALHRDTLERIARMAWTTSSREHVTSFVMEAPHLFAIDQVETALDDSDLRWTVDTPDDLATIRAIYDRLGLADTIAPYRDVVAAVRRDRALARGNAHVIQKPIHGDHRVA
jgi:spore coat polysaccharide biosynthesis protein SpsF